MYYFDMHCDTVTMAERQKKPLWQNGMHLDLSLLPEGCLTECYAIFIPDTMRGEPAWEYFLRCAAYYRDEIAKCPLIEPIETISDSPEFWARGKHAGILTVEGGAMLAGRLENVEKMAEQGVRMMTLTWNGENEIASGIKGETGLKPFGKEVLREMKRLSIVPDVSHLNEKSFWDVMNNTDVPIVATHSNSRPVCDVARNLTDDQFRAIAERDGIVGLNFYNFFLNIVPQQATIEDLVRHADRFLELGGENIVAIGSDFDGAIMPLDLPNVGHLPRLEERFTAAFGKEITEKIFWKNALAFWQRHEAK